MEARSHGIPSGPFRDLERGRISPNEYAQRVRREVHEAVREAPPPRERKSTDNGDAPKR